MFDMYLPPTPEDAFAVNPIGPVPYSGYQAFGISLIVLFPLLALTACGLRVYSRRLSGGLGLDDWLIFLATALGIPQAVFSIFYVRAGYWGIHDADIPPHPANRGLFWAYMNRVVYAPLLNLVKISALLFLLRLGGTKRSVQLAGRALIVFCVLQILAFSPVHIFTCDPIEYNWGGVREGRCLMGGAFSASLASINVVTDILTLLIPFVAFLDLKLTRRIRIALLAVFTLGGLVTMVSIVRLYLVIRQWYFVREDMHYSIGYATNTIELNLAIVTATIPALWPLARLWFPSVFESMGISRPYLYPDIEVGYISSRAGASQPTAGAGAGADVGNLTAPKATIKPALRAKTIWLPRPRPPSYIRPVAANGGLPGEDVNDGSGDRDVGLTDIRQQRVFGGGGTGMGVDSGIGGRSQSLAGDWGAEREEEEEDGFEDYHRIIRLAEAKVVYEEEDDSLMNPKLQGSEAGKSTGSEAREQ